MRWENPKLFSHRRLHLLKRERRAAIEKASTGRFVLCESLQSARRKTSFIDFDAAAVGDGDHFQIDAGLRSKGFLLRDELLRERASDLAESKEGEFRFPSGGVGEGTDLVELKFVVQRDQRAGRILLCDGNGDVQLGRPLRNGHDVDTLSTERGERACGDAVAAAHA